METRHANLVATMHDLNTAYTNYFNRKHERVGHLFQGRYRAILVDRDAYLLELSRYIHLNPVRAGLVDSPEKYRWCSYGGYLSPRASHEWLCTQQVLAQLDARVSDARRGYRHFVARGMNEEIPDPLQEVISGIVLGEAQFWEKARKRFRTLKKDREIPILRQVHQKRDLEAIVCTVAAFYGVPLERIRGKDRPAHPAAQVALYLSRKKTDQSLNEIAEFFGGRHYTAVSVAYRRVEERRRRDSRFAQELNQIEDRISR